MKNNQTPTRDIIADNYFEAIEKNSDKWIKEWNTSGYGQQNASTNKEYRGQNQLNLFFEQLKRNSSDPRWMTMAQIIKNNFQLEKGSKGARVEYHSNYTERLKKDDKGNYIIDDNGKKITEIVILPFHVAKYATVFNAKNILGIDPFKVEIMGADQLNEINYQKNTRLDLMMDRYQKETGIKIKEIPTNKACFVFGELNQIILPLRTQFSNIDSFYSTALHEMAHSTAIIDNFKRETGLFGTSSYAKEELVAETTAMLMMKDFKGEFEQQKITETNLNINVEGNSFAYIQAWIKSGSLTKNDFREAFSNAVVISQYIKSFDIEREKIIDKNENKIDPEPQKLVQEQEEREEVSL